MFTTHTNTLCSTASIINHQHIFQQLRIILSVKMASRGQKFPPQKQETQPGKEHAMNPTPQFTCPDYKPANKLQVHINKFIQ
jgi:hypothetical protein